MDDQLEIRLGEHSYFIHFASEIESLVRGEVARLDAQGRKVAVVTDTNVARVCAPVLRSMFGGAPVCVLEAGEPSKSLAGFGRVLDFLAEHKLDRTGALFAVGGGVVGDLGGFAAAAWLRGIDYYQVPTTLLAMVDSSVGGKTGINLTAGKNLVGAFHQPRAVFVGPGFLATLPPREFAAGTAEMIKAGLLGDAELFAQLERAPAKPGDAALAGMIRRCCALKARIVEGDERELAKAGGRALLNLGHTFGHAIEQATGYGAYLHGEAVAIGLCAAARLSEKLGHLAAHETGRIEKVVAAHALPTRLRTPLATRELMEAMARDKKVRAGKLRFVILCEIGRAETSDDVPTALAEACWREVGAG